MAGGGELTCSCSCHCRKSSIPAVLLSEVERRERGKVGPRPVRVTSLSGGGMTQPTFPPPPPLRPPQSAVTDYFSDDLESK